MSKKENKRKFFGIGIAGRKIYTYIRGIGEEKEKSEEKKKNWFRRHWILSGIFLLFVIIGMFQEISNGAEDIVKYSGYSQNGLIVVSPNLLLPQDSEVDRIWRISDIKSINESAMGLSEGSTRTMSKAEDFGGSVVITTAYRFDSTANANQFYNQEKQKIDIRGVKEWNLGSDCFGVDRESIISGATEGLCLRKNVVFYTKSASSSWSYASDGKDFMSIMLSKV